MLSVTCAGSRSKLSDLSDSPLLLWAVIQSAMCSLHITRLATWKRYLALSRDTSA